MDLWNTLNSHDTTLSLINILLLLSCRKCGLSNCEEGLWREFVKPKTGPVPFFPLDVSLPDKNGQHQVIKDIPKSIIILGDEYELVAVSMAPPGHFTAAFWYNQKWYHYNGMNVGFTQGLPKQNQTCALGYSWYKIKEPR